MSCSGPCVMKFDGYCIDQWNVFPGLSHCPMRVWYHQHTHCPKESHSPNPWLGRTKLSVAVGSAFLRVYVPVFIFISQFEWSCTKNNEPFGMQINHVSGYVTQSCCAALSILTTVVIHSPSAISQLRDWKSTDTIFMVFLNICQCVSESPFYLSIFQ